MNTSAFIIIWLSLIALTPDYFLQIVAGGPVTVTRQQLTTSISKFTGEQVDRGTLDFSDKVIRGIGMQHGGQSIGQLDFFYYDKSDEKKTGQRDSTTGKTESTDWKIMRVSAYTGISTVTDSESDISKIRNGKIRNGGKAHNGNGNRGNSIINAPTTIEHLSRDFLMIDNYGYAGFQPIKKTEVITQIKWKPVHTAPVHSVDGLKNAADHFASLGAAIQFVLRDNSKRDNSKRGNSKNNDNAGQNPGRSNTRTLSLFVQSSEERNTSNVEYFPAEHEIQGNEEKALQTLQWEFTGKQVVFNGKPNYKRGRPVGATLTGPGEKVKQKAKHGAGKVVRNGNMDNNGKGHREAHEVEADNAEPEDGEVYRHFAEPVPAEPSSDDRISTKTVASSVALGLGIVGGAIAVGKKSFMNKPRTEMNVEETKEENQKNLKKDLRETNVKDQDKLQNEFLKNNAFRESDKETNDAVTDISTSLTSGIAHTAPGDDEVTELADPVVENVALENANNLKKSSEKRAPKILKAVVITLLLLLFVVACVVGFLWWYRVYRSKLASDDSTKNRSESVRASDADSATLNFGDEQNQNHSPQNAPDPIDTNVPDIGNELNMDDFSRFISEQQELLLVDNDDPDSAFSVAAEACARNYVYPAFSKSLMLPGNLGNRNGITPGVALSGVEFSGYEYPAKNSGSPDHPASSQMLASGSQTPNLISNTQADFNGIKNRLGNLDQLLSMNNKSGFSNGSQLSIPFSFATRSSGLPSDQLIPGSQGCFLEKKDNRIAMETGPGVDAPAVETGSGDAAAAAETDPRRASAVPAQSNSDNVTIGSSAHICIAGPPSVGPPSVGPPIVMHLTDKVGPPSVGNLLPISQEPVGSFSSAWTAPDLRGSSLQQIMQSGCCSMDVHATLDAHTPGLEMNIPGTYAPEIPDANDSAAPQILVSHASFSSKLVSLDLTGKQV